MKNRILIAAAAATAAAIATYLVRRLKTNSHSPAVTSLPEKKSHHLTKVFAHAKNHNGIIQ